MGNTFLRIGVLTLCSIAIGCDPGGGRPATTDDARVGPSEVDETEDSDRDLRDGSEATSAIAATTGLLPVLESFAWSDGSLVPLDAPGGARHNTLHSPGRPASYDAAQGTVLDKIEDRLDDLCVGFERQGASFVLSFDECQGLFGRPLLDGFIEAELAIEPGLCGGIPCVEGVRFEVTDLDLTIGETRFVGTFALFVPRDPSAAVTLDGDLATGSATGILTTFQVTLARASVGGACFRTSMDLAVDRETGTPWNLSTVDLQTCGGCPIDGTAALTIERPNREVTIAANFAPGFAILSLGPLSTPVPLACI